jgi:Glyoxalase-like domain
MQTQLDHLVVAARTLQEGVAWCEATLGITPGAGGEHPLFGTHNRLFRIATVNFPRAYFEIIAIDPSALRAANRPAGASQRRWFDLDSEALQASIQAGPRLVHFVANTSDLSQACDALSALGIDRGLAVQASRMTPSGLLQWQITVREDGQRLFHGGLPTLIEWGTSHKAPSVAHEAPSVAVHPASNMPSSGVALHSLQMVSPQAFELQAAYQAIGLQGVQVTSGAPSLMATLQTPKGLVCLESSGF